MPTRRRLTQLAVDKLKPRPGRGFEVADGPGGIGGFALRVSEHGSKSWVIRYRVGSRQRRVTLGSAAVVPLSDARKAARELLLQVERGIDPAEARLEREQDSIEAVIEQYAERHLRRNTKTGRAVEQMLRRELRP